MRNGIYEITFSLESAGERPKEMAMKHMNCTQSCFRFTFFLCARLWLDFLSVSECECGCVDCAAAPSYFIQSFSYCQLFSSIFHHYDGSVFERKYLSLSYSHQICASFFTLLSIHFLFLLLFSSFHLFLWRSRFLHIFFWRNFFFRFLCGALCAVLCISTDSSRRFSFFMRSAI